MCSSAMSLYMYPLLSIVDAAQKMHTEVYFPASAW